MPAGARGTPAALLDAERDRAERLLNAVRLVVLLLLGVAAFAYAPTLTRPLVLVNVSVLAPALAWTLVQYRLFYHRPALPEWLSLVNPVIDITAVTAILTAYGFAQSPALALKTPIFAAYFIILAALPVASSTRKAAAVATLAVIEYGAMVAYFIFSGRLESVLSPLAASAAPVVSRLDEGARILLLACAGAVATYATRWQDRLGARYARSLREGEQLQSRLAHAQLDALKSQLQPHFLFNTLNTITALVHTDPGSAERMVSGLSELLRMSLGSVSEQEVPLSRELEVLRHYVDIQQVRFRDRLHVHLDVAPDTAAAYLPNLLLQPLVENAIKHGISPRAQGGRIDVSAVRDNGALQLTVRDDGVGQRGPARGAPAGDGVGLANCRARLASLYGDGQTFEAADAPGGGFCVRISLPFHTEPLARRGAPAR